MPLASWISSLLDIPGKVLNWKKTKLEIDKLKREDSRITRATLQDVEDYDPKYKELRSRIQAHETNVKDYPSQRISRGVVVGLVLILVLAFLAYKFCGQL